MITERKVKFVIICNVISQCFKVRGISVSRLENSTRFRASSCVNYKWFSCSNKILSRYYKISLNWSSCLFMGQNMVHNTQSICSKLDKSKSGQLLCIVLIGADSVELLLVFAHFSFLFTSLSLQTLSRRWLITFLQQSCFIYIRVTKKLHCHAERQTTDYENSAGAYTSLHSGVIKIKFLFKMDVISSR